jgi:FtsP/CotA-like multicopper oxidase with cupredoxin domain
MTHRARRLGLVLAVIAIGALMTTPRTAHGLPAGAPKTGMVCTSGSVSGSTRTFDLVARHADVDTPDGNSVLMWSYSVDPSSDPGDDWPDAQYPGPVLCASQGETVVVNLRNTLPEPSSIVFPGQDDPVSAAGGSPGLVTQEAATGDTVTYTFTAAKPGTYLYESGSDVSKQIEMGLYGALIVRPSIGPDFAYNSATTRFEPSREYLLLLGEFDPDLHHAVETGGAYDFTQLHNRYFTVNGREFPDTIQDSGSPFLPTQPYGALVRIQPNSPSSSRPALIRMINAGVDNHPFHPHGNHIRQIAQDGRLFVSPGGAAASTEHFGETIGSGQTEDFLLRWDSQATDSAGQPFNDNWDPGANPLPVGQPNYRNVTFKDSVTWYSGSPYLGYKGTLPTGTASQNICGEWYFPWHSHALNEFTNFDQGFGGMATLLRVDPQGGCFAYPSATTIVGGAIMSGAYSALGANDAAYYQVKPKTTTLATAMSAGSTTMTVASVSGFSGSPTTFPFYVRVQSEVVRVNSLAATPANTWNVTRGQLGTAAAGHTAGTTQVVTSLSNDWYAGFTAVTAGSQNFKITYTGKNCANTASATPPCTVLANPLPRQTVKICNWTIAGASGCSSATSSGWVTLPAPQGQAVGSTDVSTTWTPPGSPGLYLGTGANKGQVRVLVHSDRWTASSPAPFSSWGNFMKLVYDAP